MCALKKQYLHKPTTFCIIARPKFQERFLVLTPCSTARTEGKLSMRRHMRHYEIVFLVHPDQSEQVPAMIERYCGMITESGGTVHRQENWGRRHLEFPIKKIHKAHYVLLNIECSQDALSELESAFRFNDALLRHLTLSMKKAITAKSVMLESVEKEEAAKANNDRKYSSSKSEEAITETAVEDDAVEEIKTEEE